MIKYLITSLLLLAVGLCAHAQVQDQNLGGKQTRVTAKYQVLVDSGFRTPLDTLKSAPLWSEAWKTGVKYYKGLDSIWHRTIADSGLAVQFRTLVGVPLANIIDGSGNRIIAYDSIHTHPGALLTAGAGQAKIDSLSGILSALILQRLLLADSNQSIHSWASIGRLNRIADSLSLLYIKVADSNQTIHSWTSIGRLNKLADSLSALKVTNLGGAGFLGGGTLASRPATPTGTGFWYESDNKVLDYWNGSTWIQATQTPGSYVTNVGGSTGINRGAYLSRPSAASGSNTYYWSTDSIFWSYSDGSSWKDLKAGSGTGGGGAPLGLNKRGDSLFAVDTVPIFPDPRNTGWTGLNHMRNLQAVMALTQDTVGYSGTSDSAQLRLNLFGNSMFERAPLFEQHYIQYMSSKGFHSVGPGFISMSGQKFGINWVVPVAEWTTLSLFTGTVGTGPDGYELVSTGATADSIVIQPQTAYKNSDWMQGTVVELWWRGGSGFGSFRLVIDGVNYGTINTAASSGINRTIIRNLPYTFHVVSIAPISEGTNHIHLLGMFEYQSGTRGWLVNKVARGSSTVTQWLALNASEWQTMVGWMKPTTAFMDWVVTSMNTSDSTDLVLKMDSVFRRLRAVDTTIDRVVFGPTIFSQGGSYVIISPWASYGRALKRMVQDSLITYWDPSSLLGTNVILAMKRGMIDPDSLHRSSQFSEAEVAQILSSIGTLAYIPPPTVANFYALDGTMTIPAGVREVFMDGANNTNGTSLRFHDLNKFYMLGKGSNPGLTWDFSNPLQITITGGIKQVWDYSISTAGSITTTGASGNGIFSQNVVVGGSAVTSAKLQVNGTAAAGASPELVISNVTTTGGSITEYATDQGQIGQIAVLGSAWTPNGGFQPNSFTVYNSKADLSLIAANSTNGIIKFFTGGFATGNERARITPGGHWLIGTTTDVTTSLFTVSSTTLGTIPIPSMTTTQLNAISSPAEALMAYDNVIHTPKSYNGSSWFPISGAAHTITTPTTGSTVTLVSIQFNIINPAGTLAALTLALPSSPSNNDIVRIKIKQAITTITYSGGTVVGAPTTAAAGLEFVLTYDAGTTSWY